MCCMINGQYFLRSCKLSLLVRGFGCAVQDKEEIQPHECSSIAGCYAALALYTLVCALSTWRYCIHEDEFLWPAHAQSVVRNACLVGL